MSRDGRGEGPSPQITLASQSETRGRLLADAGVSFETASPGVDEAGVKASLLAEGATPREVADALAQMKAEKASRRRPGLVIGADQTLDLEGALFSKPETLEAARAALLQLRGRAHRLHSAVVLARDGAAVWREVASAVLHVRPFSEAWLDDYLAREREATLWSVGGYRLEGLGAQLFSHVEGDYFAVLGLPLWGLLEQLRRLGALSS